MSKNKILLEIGPDELEKLESKQIEPSHGERKHALLGGSSAGRWVNCPGSIFYQKDLPPQEASAAALEGTEAHEVAEAVLTAFLEHKMTGADHHLILPDIDSDKLEAAYGYRDIVWGKILRESVTGKAYGLEDRFVLDAGLDMSGLVDFWAVFIDDRGKRVGAICDFKFGYHHISAENNPQLAFYLAAMLAEIRRGGKDLDYMLGAIYQPRAYGKAPYEEHHFTIKSIDTWTKKFYKAAEQIFIKKKPKFKVGDWCQFCPAKGVCNHYGKAVSSKSSLALIDPDIVMLPPVDKLPDETLARLILHQDAIEEFLSAVKKVGIERAKSGKPLPGTKAVHGTSRRKWRDNEAEVCGILTQVDIDPYTQKLRGITEIEKELSKNYGKDQAKAILAECCDMTEPSIILVQESDPRDSIQGSAKALLDTPI